MICQAINLWMSPFSSDVEMSDIYNGVLSFLGVELNVHWLIKSGSWDFSGLPLHHSVCVAPYQLFIFEIQGYDS